MAGAAPRSVEAVGALVQQLRADMDRHEDRDDERFGGVYAKMDKNQAELSSLIERRVGELGTKIDGAVTNLVNAYNESSRTSSYDKGHADGVKEGKTPSAGRIAVIQGVASEAFKLIITVVSAVLMLAFAGWTLQHSPQGQGQAVTIGHSAHP